MFFSTARRKDGGRYTHGENPTRAPIAEANESQQKPRWQRGKAKESQARKAQKAKESQSKPMKAKVSPMLAFLGRVHPLPLSGTCDERNCMQAMFTFAYVCLRLPTFRPGDGAANRPQAPGLMDGAPV